MAKNKEKPQEQTFEYQGNNKMDKMAFNLRQLNGGLTYYKSKVDKHIEKYDQENK